MQTLVMKSNKWYLFICILSVLLSSNLIAQSNFRVVLDAGHGGKDPGKHSGKYYEKDIALNIVLLLGEKLDKNAAIDVEYTRKEDVFIELKERGNIANSADAHLFVSVHCNAHNTQAYGTETYALGIHANDRNFEVAKQENAVIFLEEDYLEKYAGFDPNSPEAVIGLTLMQEEYLDESLLVASYVQNNFRNDLNRTDRGVKQAGFVVLFQTSMPSILIEAGFITNVKEGEFLNSNKGQEKVALAIYDAILTYKKHLDDNFVVELKQEPEQIVDHQKVPPRVFNGVDFKVQIASGKKKLPLESYNFKGLKGVEREKIGSHYKYYYKKSSNYDEILEYQNQARKKGFSTAFIVAFKNKDRIPVSEVLKSAQN
jgi:N-acetylmuramoyl-L-alanine amidase